MFLTRLHPPLRAAVISFGRAADYSGQTLCLNEALAQLGINSIPPFHGFTFVRHASHAAQGAANKGGKDGPGKRLGAKKSGEQYVIPGNIIFRQRGTHWFPGENCAMGRDHTIYATEHGYVKYYKDSNLNPKKQYIGVALDRDDKLPYPRTAIRKRRLNMVAEKIEALPNHGEAVGDFLLAGSTSETSTALDVTQKPKKDWKGNYERTLKLRPGYMYREANWEIGRAAERANVRVPAFKPRDRWTAWRKRAARSATIAEKRLGRKMAAPKKK